MPGRRSYVSVTTERACRPGTGTASSSASLERTRLVAPTTEAPDSAWPSPERPSSAPGGRCWSRPRRTPSAARASSSGFPPSPRALAPGRDLLRQVRERLDPRLGGVRPLEHPLVLDDERRH